MMTTTPWKIKAREFANCNCSYGCPCQFSDLPTHGFCEAMGAFQIDEGYFGDVKLDGLCAAGIYQWPGAVHEGNGTMQLILDQRADNRQRDALLRILTGQDTEPMTTMWAVYSATCPNKLEPLFEQIDFQVDVDARTARVTIRNLVESAGEPIRNKVTGQEHRARIDLPHGFEYRLAEIGSGRTTTWGKIKLALMNTYGQFARLHLSNKGVVDGPPRHP